MNLKQILRTSKCFEAGDTLIVGFSGGADSLCLLDGLTGLAKEMDLRIIACHVHHGIRGAEADADAAACEKTAKALGAEFLLKKIDAPAYAERNKLTLEEAARLLRYEAFEQAAAEIEAASSIGDVRVAVAHTKSDLAETVLQRILRGTGPDGLAAMGSVSMIPGGDHQLVRPLLALTKEETRSYCEARGLEPREDSTNGDPTYLRNRIRSELMPRLAEDYNPEIEAALGRLSGLAAMDRDFFETITGQLLEELTVPEETDGADPDGKPVRLALRRKDLMDIHPALGTRIIASGLRAIGMEKDLSQVTLWAAWELLQRGRGAGEAELSGGYRFRLDHEKAILYRAGK